MADPGEGHATLFLDQTKARRAGKNYSENRASPLTLGLDDPPPHLKVWVRHWKLSWEEASIRQEALIREGRLNQTFRHIGGHLLDKRCIFERGQQLDHLR